MEFEMLYTILLISSKELCKFLKRNLKKEKNVDPAFVLHQSDNFLVVNKKWDLLMNSNDNSIKETLQIQLARSCPSKINSKLGHQFHFVHRLDYVTSGVVCLALNKKAAKAAGNSFTKRDARKYYVALVRGWVTGDKMSISFAVGEDSAELTASKRMCVETDPCCIYPKHAQTRLIVLQRGMYGGYPATKIMLRPTTGRRHQLRVHLSHIGHTIVGDFTYSHRKDVTPPRTFLHALRLILPNPVEELDVKTDDPFNNVSQWQPFETLNQIDDCYCLLDDEHNFAENHKISACHPR